MTKTEARAYIRRCREGLREAEAALVRNDAEALRAAVLDAGGSLGEIESAVTDSYGDGRGVAGLISR
jgi:hypothetical protein